MADLSHLNALELGLSNELARLSAATTESEKLIRRAWVAQYEKQIADEKSFLGLSADNDDTSDDDLFAQLMA